MSLWKAGLGGVIASILGHLIHGNWAATGVILTISLLALAFGLLRNDDIAETESDETTL